MSAVTAPFLHSFNISTSERWNFFKNWVVRPKAGVFIIPRTTFSLNRVQKTNVALGNKETRSELINAHFDFCHIFRTLAKIKAAALMFHLAPVTIWFFHTKKKKKTKPTSGKFLQRPQEASSLRLWNYGGKNAGIRAKQCEICEECFPWQSVGMIQGECAAKQRLSILRVQQRQTRRTLKPRLFCFLNHF